MKIALDFDDVLSNTMGSWIRHFNEKITLLIQKMMSLIGISAVNLE